MEEAFDLFDKDGDGTISTGELKNLLRCFGQKSNEEEIKKIIKENDKDNSGSISFDEFVVIMSKIIMEPEVDEELYEAYKVFDRDDKGINADELSGVMTKLL
mmetsp:Transcript_48869/g.66543  ORF Transcript_48869/g.66543 Transcript_48869/m.66543 type:complete len:102 (-) Transcript_48869:210-515(-)